MVSGIDDLGEVHTRSRGHGAAGPQGHPRPGQIRPQPHFCQVRNFFVILSEHFFRPQVNFFSYRIVFLSTFQIIAWALPFVSSISVSFYHTVTGCCLSIVFLDFLSFL